MGRLAKVPECGARGSAQGELRKWIQGRCPTGSPAREGDAEGRKCMGRGCSSQGA